MPSALLRPVATTRVSTAAPTLRLGNAVLRMLLKGGTPAANRSYQKFALPEAIRGCKVVKAEWRTQPISGFDASRTMTATPHVRANYENVSNANTPALLTTPAAVTKTHSGTSACVWDVLTHVQAHADGLFEFEGWEISTTSTTELRLGGQGDQYAATLYVEWLDPPQPPTGLSPDGGVTAATKPALTWETSAPGLTTVQVQFGSEDPNTGVWTTTWDSGPQPAATPGFDLAGPNSTYGGASGTVQWRVYKEWWTDGQVTDPSEPATFQVVPYPSLTLLPLDATADPNPARAWSTSAQHAARLLRYGSVTGRLVSRSANLGPDVRVLELLFGATKDGQGFRDVLEVLDRPDRLELPGFPRYQRVEDSWTYSANAAGAVVVGISMQVDTDPNYGPIPVARFIIDCNQVPDNLIIFRGTEFPPINIDADTTSPNYVGIVGGSNVRYSVRTYEWPPNMLKDVAVVAQLGSTRKAPVRASLRMEVPGTWIQHEADDGTVTRVRLDDLDGSLTAEWAPKEQVVELEVVGGKVVLQRTGKTGNIGEIAGTLMRAGDLTVEAQVDAWNVLRDLAYDGEELRIVHGTENFKAHLHSAGPARAEAKWASTRDVAQRVGAQVRGIAGTE